MNPRLVSHTLMHSTLSGEGHRFRHRGHWAFSGQVVGISTVGASSSSTWPVDVSTATQTVVRFSSTVTLPDGKEPERHLRGKPCSTQAGSRKQTLWELSVWLSQSQFCRHQTVSHCHRVTRLTAPGSLLFSPLLQSFEAHVILGCICVHVCKCVCVLLEIAHACICECCGRLNPGSHACGSQYL